MKRIFKSSNSNVLNSPISYIRDTQFNFDFSYAPSSDVSFLCSVNDTALLTALVYNKQIVPDLLISGSPQFLVEYFERASSIGVLPGTRTRREYNPSEKEILSGRILDRTLRPLFNTDFPPDMQLTSSILCVDRNYDPDILSINAASVAQQLLSKWYGITCHDSIAAAIRIVGKKSPDKQNLELIINPTNSEQYEYSDVNVIVGGTEDSILTIEGAFNEIPSDDINSIIGIAHEALQIPVKQLKQTIDSAPEPSNPPHPKISSDRILYHRNAVHEQFNQILEYLLPIFKSSLFDSSPGLQWDSFKSKCFKDVASHFATFDHHVINEAMEKALSLTIQNKVLEEGIRSDGRSLDQIRDISVKLGALPNKVHGSALFCRGKTHSLASCTRHWHQSLAYTNVKTGGSAYPKSRHFTLNYMFPGFATNELKMLKRNPNRREIGHGFLAQRSLIPTIPSPSVFPYATQINADVLSSNGSSSMASVCAGSLALHSANVPISNLTAGIAMGCVVSPQGSNLAILTDIQGLEDYHGHLDFKVAGTKDGITAIQMDTKTVTLSPKSIFSIVDKGVAGYRKILGIMQDEVEKQYTPEFAAKQSEYHPQQVEFPHEFGNQLRKEFFSTFRNRTLGILEQELNQMLLRHPVFGPKLSLLDYNHFPVGADGTFVSIHFSQDIADNRLVICSAIPDAGQHCLFYIAELFRSLNSSSQRLIDFLHENPSYLATDSDHMVKVVGIRDSGAIVQWDTSKIFENLDSNQGEAINTSVPKYPIQHLVENYDSSSKPIVTDPLFNFEQFLPAGGPSGSFLSGFLHISQISTSRVSRVTDYVKEGQEIKVYIKTVMDTTDPNSLPKISLTLIPPSPSRFKGARRQEPQGQRQIGIERTDPPLEIHLTENDYPQRKFHSFEQEYDKIKSNTTKPRINAGKFRYDQGQNQNQRQNNTKFVNRESKQVEDREKAETAWNKYNK